MMYDNDEVFSHWNVSCGNKSSQLWGTLSSNDFYCGIDGPGGEGPGGGGPLEPIALGLKLEFDIAPLLLLPIFRVSLA